MHYARRLFTHISTTDYSQVLVFTQQGVVDRTKIPKLRNGSKGDSNTGSLDCESGILKLSHRAPHSRIQCQLCVTCFAGDSRYTGPGQVDAGRRHLGHRDVRCYGADSHASLATYTGQRRHAESDVRQVSIGPTLKTTI